MSLKLGRVGGRRGRGLVRLLLSVSFEGFIFWGRKGRWVGTGTREEFALGGNGVVVVVGYG